MYLYLLTITAVIGYSFAHSAHSYGRCNQTKHSNCPEAARPVCGFRTNGLPLTYWSVCEACTDYKLIAYLEGDCQLHVRTCHPHEKSEADCFQGRLKMKSLCGFLSNGAFEEVRNVRLPYTHVVDRACPLISIRSSQAQQTQEELTYSYCQDGLRKLKCSLRDQPTCGITSVGLPREYVNPCTACSDETVFAYLPGRCDQLTKPCSPHRIDCDRIKAPSTKTCGFEMGKRPVQLDNNFCCRGTTYQQSLPMGCPKYPEQLCPEMKDWNCPLRIDWVCGVSKDGHKWTYINECSACSLPHVIKYTFGKC